MTATALLAPDRTVRTTCPYCGVGCQMNLHVKDDLIDELAGAERIYIVTHPDEAGQRVARRLVETLGKRARIVPPLPNAKDVNELAGRPRASEIFAALVHGAR